MGKVVQRIDLDSMSPGTERFVKAHRYGKPGARPKAYLQASLHADEIPGMLAGHHLIGLLDDADARGEIKGEIIVVPVANPVGAGQVINTTFAGRYDFRSGINYFPFKNKVVRWNTEFLYLYRSAVGYTSVPYPVGGSGPVFYTTWELAF